jgi:hypothetical protein
VTNEPTPQALRDAIRTVLDEPKHRSRASLMADEFGGIDTRSEILRIVSKVSQSPHDNGSRRRDVADDQSTQAHLSASHLAPIDSAASPVILVQRLQNAPGTLDANRAFRRR